ncbi:hypothetical protein GOP47_0018311 [Adiantum capillus-veneris]|uniref:Uncharacterized protein n=1 Tax=Adiantum capillus-veneris TaxID=13818 RepID=A0A9D4UH13_ADICA|nr:hypothetical protein GOP47_0018311 [Adiantum capillus-veneris]
MQQATGVWRSMSVDKKGAGQWRIKEVRLMRTTKGWQAGQSLQKRIEEQPPQTVGRVDVHAVAKEEPTPHGALSSREVAIGVVGSVISRASYCVEWCPCKAASVL